MLYTDCWFPLRGSSFKLDSLRTYLERSLDNRLKNYLRNRASSQDLMDRGTWMEPNGEDDDSFVTEGGDANFVNNLPDLRPHESAEAEDTSLRVRTALERVPPTLAIVGQWYYVDFVKQSEIANRLQCTQANVSIMLARFRSIFARQYHHLLSKEL